MSEAKEAVLQDDLARELYAEETRLLADQHAAKHETLTAWAGAKQAYLDAREVIEKSQDARFHRSLLDAFAHELSATSATSLASLHSLGQEVLARAFKTPLSSYTYEHPERVRGREAALEGPWRQLQKSVVTKREVLEDHLTRTLLQDAVRLSADVHRRLFEDIEGWVGVQKAYLGQRETIETEEAATFQLNLLGAHDVEKRDQRNGRVAALLKRGEGIRAARHGSAHSSWQYEGVPQVQALEAAVEGLWDELKTGHVGKHEFLQDAMARNVLKARVLLLAQQHAGLQARLESWLQAREAYLLQRECNESLDAVAVAARLLEAFRAEKAQMASTSLASLKKLGVDVKTTRFASELSQWEYPEPGSVDRVEATLTSAFSKVREAAGAAPVVRGARGRGWTFGSSTPRRHPAGKLGR
jgi:hypothetical protein